MRDRGTLEVVEKERIEEARGERGIPIAAIAVALLLPVLLLGLTVACPAGACGAAMYLHQAGRLSAAGGDQWFLGIVQDREFLPLVPGRAFGVPARLTGIPMQAAASPESGELDLARYESRVVLVRGHDGGGWIYSAEVVARAGPILSALVRLVLSLWSG